MPAAFIDWASPYLSKRLTYLSVGLRQLLLQIGSHIPLICPSFESSRRTIDEKNIRMLLLPSVRSQFRLKIGPKNGQNLKFIKNAHSTYQIVQLGELITTVCLFLSFDFIFWSLGGKKCEICIRVGSGAQSWLTHTSDLCRFRKLWPLRI
jgi:hypothetical protein